MRLAFSSAVAKVVRRQRIDGYMFDVEILASRGPGIA
jgi:hypothetical protein